MTLALRIKNISVLLVTLCLYAGFAWAEPDIDPYLEGTEEVKEESNFSARTQAISALMAKKSGTTPQTLDSSAAAGPEELSLITGIQGLAVCLGIFFIGIYLYKKYVVKTPTVNSRRIRIIERSQISAKTNLILAEVEGRRIVLAVGSEQVTAISTESPQRTLKLKDDMRVLCSDDITLSA